MRIRNKHTATASMYASVHYTGKTSNFFCISTLYFSIFNSRYYLLKKHTNNIFFSLYLRLYVFTLILKLIYMYELFKYNIVFSFFDKIKYTRMYQYTKKKSNWIFRLTNAVFLLYLSQKNLLVIFYVLHTEC